MNDNNVRARFGLAIKNERKQMGLSQEKLAFESNLHRTYIGSVERGERNVSLENILKIAKTLNLSASELLKKARL